MKNRILHIIKAVLFSVIIGLTASGFSYGQDDSVKKYAELDGHNFLNNTMLGLPFTNTYYRSVLGAGQTVGFDIPDVYINDKKVLTLSGNLLYTNLDFTYQQQVREWLAFRGDIKITAQVGTETGALIAAGINLTSGLNLTWIARIYENRKMYLSGGLYLSRSGVDVVDVYSFAKRIIDSGGITRDNKIINSVPITRGGMRVNYAYAFNKTFGAIARVIVDYGESAYRGEGDAWNYSYGLGLDANLLPNQGVPLGFLAGFMHTSIPSTQEQTDKQPNVLLFQFSYTGRKDLNLGLEVTYNWYKPRDFKQELKFLTINLNSTVYL